MTERERLLRERAALRRQLKDELAALQKDSADGTMEVDELRQRLNAIVDRFLADAMTPELRASMDEALEAYGALHGAVELQRALEDLWRMFGGDAD